MPLTGRHLQLTRVLMRMHLLQRVTQRQQWTLRRSHHIQQLILIVLLIIEQCGRMRRMQMRRSAGVPQMQRRPRAAHVRGIQFVRIGPSIGHQRLPVTTVGRETRYKLEHTVGPRWGCVTD